MYSCLKRMHTHSIWFDVGLNGTCKLKAVILFQNLFSSNIEATLPNVCIHTLGTLKGTHLILTMCTLPLSTRLRALMRLMSSSSLQEKSYWNRNRFTMRFVTANYCNSYVHLRLYLQDSIQDEKFHEEEIPISRSLVNIKYSSLGRLSLKSHSDVVECFEVNTLKLQIWVPQVLDVAWI